MISAILVRVQSIRSQNPVGIGGCIFVGTEINDAGDVIDAKSYFVVKASHSQLGVGRVQAGQWWRVRGELEVHQRNVNGYLIREKQIKATETSLVRVSGEHIVTFIAECEDFQGIGMVKARRLWTTYGEELYRLLDNGDVGALTRVLTEESAKQVVAAWLLQGKARTLQWLQRSGIDVAVGRKLISFFGAEAQEKLETDPYRLLSFSATWAQVDSLARDHFKIGASDPRRLQGAVEEALYRIFGDGHTRAPIPMVISRLRSILDDSCRAMAKEALANGLSNGSFVIGQDGNVHPIGAWVMEATVARAIHTRVTSAGAQPLLHSTHIDSLLSAYEASEGIALNDAQREAVHSASNSALSLIVGGAGVGKTTVLKALYKVYDETKTRIFQVALAGRAAKRMLEATARPASTLASFVKTVKEEDLGGRCVVVIDESSMVDIITMNRFCQMLPDHVRIVLAGDTAQLMPVGPGLVLHALAKIKQIPQVELKVVKRYGGGIAYAAHAVRNGIWPDLVNDADAAISFIPCEPRSIDELVVDLYATDRDNTQILSPRRNSLGGTRTLNALCQNRFSRCGRPLMVYQPDFQTMVGTGFYLGDQVLCTRNLWEWGLQNGSLGRLTEIEEKPRLLTNADGHELGYAIGWVLWDDGERRPIVESMLDDLELGYAVTVHKAQGSQWPRVIVALTGSRMLDRTLIYTAMTRAQRQVLLVGNATAARQAVEGLPRASTRMVGLDTFLQQYFDESDICHSIVSEDC